MAKLVVSGTEQSAIHLASLGVSNIGRGKGFPLYTVFADGTGSIGTTMKLQYSATEGGTYVDVTDGAFSTTQQGFNVTLSSSLWVKIVNTPTAFTGDVDII